MITCEYLFELSIATVLLWSPSNNYRLTPTVQPWQCDHYQTYSCIMMWPHWWDNLQISTLNYQCDSSIVKLYFSWIFVILIFLLYCNNLYRTDSVGRCERADVITYKIICAPINCCDGVDYYKQLVSKVIDPRTVGHSCCVRSYIMYIYTLISCCDHADGIIVECLLIMIAATVILQ